MKEIKASPGVKFLRGELKELTRLAEQALEIVRTSGTLRNRGWAEAHPLAFQPPCCSRPSTALLTRMFTATRRFCALPSAVELSAAGSASAMPVGVSMR